MLTQVMGFGETPAQFATRNMADHDEVFATSLAVVADAIDLPLDAITTEATVASTRARR